MEAKAKALGWDQRYAGNPAFRSRFDEMYAAVEQLPPHRSNVVARMTTRSR